jgi:hypothetical protein
MDVEKVKDIGQKWSAVGAACLLTMVQGNVFAIDWNHWFTAAKTATGATIIYLVCLYFPRVGKWLEGRVGGSVLIGLATFASDIFVHPTHFGMPHMEAVTTALGATVLSFLLYKQLKPV